LPFPLGGLPLAIVRPFNVYGPRQVGDGAIRGIILQALQHAPITLYNDGTQIRAWCYVDDFVDGVDIVVEECDSLDMKAVVREAARSRGIAASISPATIRRWLATDAIRT